MVFNKKALFSMLTAGMLCISANAAFAKTNTYTEGKI